MNIGLVFGMIVALLMIIMILVFGYQQIRDITDLQKDADMIRMISKLETAVDRVQNMGGESSEKIRLSFPSSVDAICFIPIKVYSSYEGRRVAYNKNDLINGLQELEYVGTYDDAIEIAGIRMPASGENDYYDEEMPIAVFFGGYKVPAWYKIEYLEPSEKDGKYMCVTPGDIVWLQRVHDNDGAWVDVEES